MITSPSGNITITGRQSIPILLALVIAGIAGNYFSFPIFFNIDFIFGSIFALLVLQFFGCGRAVAAAAVIAGYTFFLWNHPYAIIIMTAEVAVVGMLMSRRKMGLIQADALYWLFLGMPLAYLFYHPVMHVPASDTFFIMTKQVVNGIANALIARLIFTWYAHRTRALLIPYREIVYNLLALFVLCPALIMLAVESRTDFNIADRQIRTALRQDGLRVDQRLKTWVENRKSAIVNLAEMAASRSPQQMQPYLEMAKRSDVNFRRIGLLNSEATTTAIFPLIDELGQNNIGTNFADRPFNRMLKQTLKPMLTEVVMGRQDIPRPEVLILVPVVIQGEYAGRVAGTLSLEQIREHLDKSSEHNYTLYTLIDKNNNVIMSNRTDQKIMAPFLRGKGALKSLDKGISQWVPDVPPNTPLMERWGKSFYVAETAIGSLAEWKLILEQPVAPFRKALFDQFTGKLTLLLLILLVTLALAEFISRKIVDTLVKLRTLTYELPVRLATDGNAIIWPDSGIKETNHLINNFREMAQTLSGQFVEIRQINESLEQRVEERTAELRKSEEAYRTVADFTNDWEFWLAPDRSLRYISPSCEQHTGYRAEEFLQDPDLMYRITHPEERDHLASHIPVNQDGERNPNQHRMDLRIRTRSGELRWFAHVCQAVYDGDGKYMGQRASNSDITERKQAEDALKKSEALYHSLVETSQDLIWQCDTEGRYTYLNLAWEQVFGYELDEMLGKKFNDFQNSENAALDLIRFNRLLQGDSIDRFETAYVGKSGNEIHLVFNALFVSDENGEIVGASGTAYDITLRKRMEEALLESAEKLLEQHDELRSTEELLRVQIDEYKAVQAQLQEAKGAAEAANSTKSRFLATMSHEIRTPMNGVIGMIELLQHTGLSREQHEYAESAKKSGINLVRLLNDILDLSKIEADKLELEMSDFDLRPVISDIISLMAPQAREKGVELSASIDADVPTELKGDGGRLRQLLTNLVGNAIKFTPEGEVTLRILKETEDQSSVLLRFIVRDSGIGIAPDKLEQIFEPFTQSDSSTTRKYGGTGLGLAICKQLTELMGGRIGVESTEGRGSTFWSTIVMEKQDKRTLPLPNPPPLGVGTKVSPQRGEVGGGSGSAADGGISILLTEDDPVVQKIIPLLLMKYGYRVDVAGNGREALRMLGKKEYAVVLMDCMMPEMNGYEVTAVIRDPESDVRRNDIPVIALTGNVMKEDRDRCVAAGMDDHLPKPLILADLLAKLDKWSKISVHQAPGSHP